MRSLSRNRQRFIPFLLLASHTRFAHSHVKWFAEGADFSAAPLAPAAVLTAPLFSALLLLSFCAMLGTLVIAARTMRGISTVAHPSMDYAGSAAMALLLRPGIALYLAASALYFRDAPITLAPELAIGASWLPPLQIALATLALFRSASLPVAAGILALYAYSAYLFGMFHMLDYIFIAGIAFFMVLDSRRYNNLPKALVMLRITAGFSLLWAGVEKWLHPEWSVSAVTHALPQLFAIFEPGFVVMSAGFVEYFLAFLLVFGRRASQYAALTLLALLFAAIPIAGWVDAIGHLPLIAILLSLANTSNQIADYDLTIAGAKDSFVRALLFVFSVPFFILSYWLADAFAYDRDIDIEATLLAVALSLIALFACKIIWQPNHSATPAFSVFPIK